MGSEVLSASLRSVIGKQVKAIRRQGRMPAVLYGAGTEPLSIELETRAASKILDRASGSTLLQLQLEGQEHMVLVREIQRDVIRRNVMHVDFLKVAMDVRITAEVPIELVGRAPAVEELGGVLVTGINSIEVEALPADLRDRVTVDLESLVKIDDSITAGDLFLGEGVELLTDPAELVARVIYQVEEVLEEVVEPEVVPVAAEPELVERGKREEELPEGEQPKP
ncbi:MAG TPA: 50S ribosomal protein L25 [Anaerolineales bacterium]|nr:50S ribosomal protein L25 [Anaerolineales bacterium]